MRHFYYCTIAILLFCASCKDEEMAPPPAAVFDYQIVKEISTGSATSVYTTPSVVFTHAIEQTVKVEGNDYKPVLESVKLYKGDIEIPGTFTFSSDNKSGKFYAEELLPEESALKVVIKSHWSVQLDGEWSVVTSQGQLSSQSTEGTFTTVKYSAPAEIIVQYLPANNSTGQSVVTYPIVVFKKSFESALKHAEDGRSYRPVLEEIALLQAGQKVNSELVWNSTRDTLMIKPLAVLQGQTSYTVQVKSHWEVERNGAWGAVRVSGQTPVSVSTSTFITSALSDVNRILTENIVATYPVNLQYFFLQDEYAKGYLVLKTGMQNALVKPASGEQLEARFTSPGVTEIKVPMLFDENTLTLSYDMPTLANQKIYKVRYVKIAVGGNERELYSTHFRTSVYNTFTQKINAFTNKKGYSWQLYTGVDELKSQFENATESFDLAEIKSDSLIYPGYKGLYYGTGLLQFEAQGGVPLVDNAITFLYKDLPGSGLSLTWRSAGSVGIPPKNAIFMSQGTQESIKQLKQSEIDANTVTLSNPINVLVYNLNLFIDRDYWNIYQQANSNPNRDSNPYMKKVVFEYFSNRLTFTDYKVKIKYRLPGKNVVTSEKEITIDYKY